MFGEINPKMLGKTNAAEFSLDSLSLTGKTPAYNAPTYTLNVTGLALVNDTANVLDYPFTIQNGNSVGTYMAVSRGTNLGYYGYGATSVGLEIFDGFNNSTWLRQGGQTTGRVQTLNNVLDDGSGNATFASGITANAYSSITGSSGQADVFDIFSTGASNSQIYQRWISSGTQRLEVAWDNINGIRIYDLNNNSTWLTQASQTAGNIQTLNNTLDDGTGNLTMVGTGDPILRLRRSSYSTNFISRIRFVDNNTSSKYWELGTDVNGNKGADLYLYQQGPGALGLAMQITGKGYLYLGFTGPWFQTTVTTPSTGNQTITAAQLLGGLVIAPVTSSAFTWTTDTGTNIYSAMGSPLTGTTFIVLYSNDNNAAGAVMTIAFGSGVSGNLRSDTLNNGQSMVIYFRCTGTNTFTCYS